MVAATSDIATPIDILRSMVASSANFQTWVSATQTLNGDDSTQLASLVLTGVGPDNTDDGVLYWVLKDSVGQRDFTLYKDAAKQNDVTNGLLVGDGSLTFSETNNSGLSGSVTVTYTVDDGDSGNTIDTKLKSALTSVFVDQVRAANEDSLPTQPFAVITDIEYERERRALGEFDPYTETGTLMLFFEAQVASAHISDDDGLNAGFDFRNNVGDVIKDLEAEQNFDGRLHITNVSYVQKPMRVDPKEAIAHADAFNVTFGIDWVRP